MKTPTLIKSLCCIISFAGLNIFAQNNLNQGQGNTQWKINGNIADENHFLGTKNEFPIKFRTNDIERFRITPEGNFGIGTSAPEEKLDVNGNAVFRFDLKLTNIQLDFTPQTKSMMVLDANGNVTKVPYLTFVNSSYQDDACLPESQDILQPTWKNGTNKIFTKCPQINVGIGTNAPTAKLDVRGTTFTTKFALGFANPQDMGNNYFKMKVPVNFSTPTNIFTIQSNTASSENLFAINNLGQIKANGFVGEFKLVSNLDESVNANLFILENNQKRLVQMDNQGLIKARRIIVNQEVWADYVFEPNYRLLNLKELERYLLINKHLPEVPSEKEVLEKGNDLGEMDAVLLKKIEELTLYLIELNKKIEEQALELEKIKSTLK